MVSAAFIGPGTVTTAAKSGSAYGSGLLWALLFSTLACLLLQEASARITLLTGKNIGESMRARLGTTGPGKVLLALTALAITGGAAAYQMGNLIGAREGIVLIGNLDSRIVTLLIGAVAALILFIPSLKIVSRIMGILVLILGISFLYTAVSLKPPLSDVLSGMLMPSIPDNNQAPLLILGLIGTTIVPYNIFLGSGLGKQNKSVREMRFGLGIAIILGGIFSMAVVIVGSAVNGDFSFKNLAEALVSKGSDSGKFLLGMGLFAAGFTSSITAPLASAITLKSLFDNNSRRWKEKGTYYRLSWILVLLTGLSFALLDIKPIPAIITAQALNGFILPFVSFFLVWILNDTAGTGNRNSLVNNLFMGITLMVTLLIGLKNLSNVMGLEKEILNSPWFTNALIILSLVITLSFMLIIIRKNAR